MGTETMAEFRAICKRGAVKWEITKLEIEAIDLRQRIAATDSRSTAVRDILEIQLERKTARLQEARLALLTI